MIGGLATLLIFQLAGEALVRLFALPLPGPVAGMILLFLSLMLRDEVPEGLSVAADGLLQNLGLLFVPAGAGVITYVGLLRQEWLPITVALFGSTLITVVVTALTMEVLVRRRQDEAS